jgi:hypothetical protein
MDWLKERCSMFWCHPIPPAAITSQNQKMQTEHYYRPVQYCGVEAGKGISTSYGFNLVVNAQAPKDKQEVLHDLYKFVMSDLVDCWKETAPLTLARKSGWTDHSTVKNFPYVDEVLRAKDEGVFLPRTVVYNELADATHRGVQKIMLNNADIKATLDEIAAEVAREFPDVTWDKMLVDAMTTRMVLKPSSIDTVVATNLHADILSDLAAALAGSLGIAPTANIDPERRFPSMFEPIHGSAFDITGKGIANPVASFWTAVQMLEHLGESVAAARLMRAVEQTTCAGVVTPDLGGDATTADVTRAVCDAIRRG